MPSHVVSDSCSLRICWSYCTAGRLTCLFPLCAVAYRILFLWNGEIGQCGDYPGLLCVCVCVCMCVCVCCVCVCVCVCVYVLKVAGCVSVYVLKVAGCVCVC